MSKTKMSAKVLVCCESLSNRRSVFYTKILPHILQQNKQGIRSINVIEQEWGSARGLVVPEIRDQYLRVISESKGNGFQTTVKIWEDGLCPPYYNIHIQW